MPTRKTPRASERKPENVYVMADQLRQQSCGSAGDALAKTPSIDRLTGEGMYFDDAVVSMPGCAWQRMPTGLKPEPVARPAGWTG